MKAVLVPLLVLILVAGLSVWFFQGDDPDSPNLGGPAGSEEQPPESAVGTRPKLEGAKSPSPATTAATIETVPFSPPATAVVVEDGMRVRVIDKATSRPIPQAVLGVVDLNRFDPQPLLSGEISLFDIEEIVNRCGIKIQADENGEALVPRPAGEVLICAQTESLFGARQFDASLKEPVLLKCKPIGIGRVQVVDGDGKPCPGIPVSMSLNLGFFSPVIWRGITEDPDGVAVFRDMRFVESLMKIEGMAATQREMTVGIAIPMKNPVQATLKSGPLPKDPIRLELPQTGQVRVDLEVASGERVPNPVSVGITSSGPNPLGMDMAAVLDPRALVRRLGGTSAVFTHVGLGLDLKIEARDPARAWNSVVKTMPGPRVPGEQVAIALAFDKRATWLVGRIVDDSGEPITGVSLRTDGMPVEWYVDMMSISLPLVTDSEGRFRILVNPGGLIDTPSANLILTTRLSPTGVWTGQEQRARCRVTGPFQPGKNDLGDLVLRPLPPLVQGVVLDENRKPVARVRISMGPGGLEATLSDAGGRFTVHGESEEPSVNLTITRDGFISESRNVQVGGDVEIVLKHAGSLIGNIITPEGVSPSKITVQVGEESTEVSDDGRFVVKGLAAGPVHVAFQIEEEKGDLVIIPDVNVEAGASRRDPLLKDVDLRDIIKVFRIEVVDETGAALTGADVRRVSEGGEFHTPETTDTTGHCSLLSVSPELKVRASRSGAQSVDMVLSAGRNVITLHSSVTLHLRLASDSAVPSTAMTLMPILRKRDPGGVLDTTGRMWSPELLTLPFRHGWKADLPLSGPGSYEVTFMVFRGGETGAPAGSANIESRSPVKREVKARQGGRVTREVRFSQAALDKALKSMN